MKEEHRQREMNEIVSRIGGSCECGTMTPEPSRHLHECTYRSLAARLSELELLPVAQELAEG